MKLKAKIATTITTLALVSSSLVAETTYTEVDDLVLDGTNNSYLTSKDSEIVHIWIYNKSTLSNCDFANTKKNG